MYKKKNDSKINVTLKCRKIKKKKKEYFLDNDLKTGLPPM